MLTQCILEWELLDSRRENKDEKPLTTVQLRQSMEGNFKDPNVTSRTCYTRVGYLLACTKNSLQRIYWKYKISGVENVHCVKRKTWNTYTNIPSNDCNYLGILPGTPRCGFLPTLKLSRPTHSATAPRRRVPWGQRFLSVCRLMLISSVQNRA